MFGLVILRCGREKQNLTDLLLMIKKPLIVSNSEKNKKERAGGKKEAERVKGEGENMVTMGEEDEVSRRGCSGEGEKMVRIGQVEVRVSKEEEQNEEVHILSPVLKGRGGSPKVLRRKKVVVLDVADDGKVHRSIEDDDVGDQPALNHHLVLLQGRS